MDKKWAGLPKRTLGWGLVFIIILLCLIPGAGALSPEQAQVRVFVTPDQMAEAGKATVTMAIKNESSTKMEAIAVAQGSTRIRELGSLDAGKESSATWEADITADKLGHPLTYTLVWVQDGEAQSKPFDVTVRRIDANPSLRMTRTVSSQTVEAGQTVDIRYEIINDGNITFDNLILTDTVSGVVGSKPRIRPGETVVFTASPTILSNTESAPKATFLYAGNAMELPIEPVKILLAQSQVVLDVKVDKAEVQRGDVVKISGTIQNAGGAAITKLSVSDEFLGEVYRANELAAGATATFSKEVTIEEAQDYLFRLTYNTQRGETLQSDAFLSIHIEGELPPPPKMRVEVTPAVTTLKNAGEVTWNIEVFNEGTVPITGLTVSERAEGDVATAELIGPGQSGLYQATIYVEYNREMRFSVTAMDSAGRAFTVSAGPVSVLVGPQPTQSAIPASGTVPMPSAPRGLAFVEKLLSFDLVGFLYTLLAILVGLVLLLIVLLMITGMHRGMRYLRDRNGDELR